MPLKVLSSKRWSVLATDQGSRMVTEKILATGEAQVTTVAAAMRGQGSMSLLAMLSTSTGSAFAPIDGVFRDRSPLQHKQLADARESSFQRPSSRYGRDVEGHQSMARLLYLLWVFASSPRASNVAARYRWSFDHS
jgi:hypothetical protein